MKNIIQGKITYYKTQLGHSIDSFLRSNKREDRERMIKNRSKIEAYTEVLDILNEKKKIVKKKAI